MSNDTCKPTSPPSQKEALRRLMLFVTDAAQEYNDLGVAAFPRLNEAIYNLEYWRSCAQMEHSKENRDEGMMG